MAPYLRSRHWLEVEKAATMPYKIAMPMLMTNKMLIQFCNGMHKTQTEMLFMGFLKNTLLPSTQQMPIKPMATRICKQ